MERVIKNLLAKEGWRGFHIFGGEFYADTKSNANKSISADLNVHLSCKCLI